MCGIAGGVFWGQTIGPSEGEAAVASMVAALDHRGPDGHGVHSIVPARAGDPFVVLGHTRLAILDVSSAGAQPMGDAGKPWITYNGEAYNFSDLKRELEQRGVR